MPTQRLLIRAWQHLNPVIVAAILAVVIAVCCGWLSP